MNRFLLATLLLIPAHAVLAESESAARIDAAARAALQREAQALGGEAQLDLVFDSTRLPARCAQPLQAGLASGARPVGNTTVQVRCTANGNPWALNIPARVQVFAEVMVASRPLTRGVPLASDDIARKRVDLASLGAGVLTDSRQVVGKKLRYPVAAGTVLSNGVFESQPLVRRGQTVVVISGSPGFEVRATGEALADGQNGDRIQVRNRQSRRVLEGQVEASGVVRVPL
jgi:flagella basal body P-ring formation protein FlgA